MLRPGRVGGDEGKVDLSRLRRRKLNLCLFGCLTEALQSQLVRRQIDAFRLFEFGCQKFKDCRIEIFTAEERVPVGRFHFKHAVPDFEDRNI